MVIEAKGHFTINRKFGKQFNVKEYKESLPAIIYGTPKYFESGLVEGIGPKFAKKIVEKFGEGTINIVENHPMKLLDIPKIGVRRVQAIKDSWSKYKDIKDLMIFLSDCGVSTSVAHKIYKIYGDKSITKLKGSPYGIVDDVYGIGFKTADIISERLGQSKESYNRCRTRIFHILSKLAGGGHCYASFNNLVEEGKKLLDIPEHIIAMTFRHLRNINELGPVYIKRLTANLVSF